MALKAAQDNNNHMKGSKTIKSDMGGGLLGQQWHCHSDSWYSYVNSWTKTQTLRLVLVPRGSIWINTVFPAFQILNYQNMASVITWPKAEGRCSFITTTVWEQRPRSPQVELELATNCFQLYAIANLNKTCVVQ